METKFNFKEIQEREDRLAPGHRMCAGCGGTIAVRNVLKALHPGDKAVIGNADVWKYPLSCIRTRPMKTVISTMRLKMQERH